MSANLTIQSERAEGVSAPASTGFTIPLLPRGRVDNVLFRSQVGLREDELDERALIASLDSPEARSGVVFPSHFFEYSHTAACLNRLEENGLPFSVQISPGAELRDYLPDLQALALRTPALKASVELVFDRAPHGGDWEIIRSLGNMGLSFRYVYCPVKEINAIETVRALPREIYPDLYFYFAAKLHRYDSQITPDEIVLMINGLREALPDLPIRVVNHLSRVEPAGVAGISRVALDLRGLERDFRQDPQFDIYLKNYPKLGEAGWARKMAMHLNRRSITAPFVSLFYWFLMLLKNPPEASVVFLVAMRNLFLFIGYMVRHQVRQAFVWGKNLVFKTYFLFRGMKYRADVFGYRSWHAAYFFVRNNAARLGFYLYLNAVRVFVIVRHVIRVGSFHAWHKFMMGYYFVRNHAVVIYYSFRNPMWAMEQRSPRTYRIIGYPLVRAFWFTKYQIEKRIFGLHRGEA